MTYFCLNCGESFERPKTIEEKHGEPWRIGEKHRVSPCCLDSYTKAVSCTECEELIAAGTDAHGLCRKCAEKTVSRLQYLLLNEFTDAQREVLNDAFDGVHLTEPEKAKVVIP